jgi:hypothetical protein
VAKAKIPSEFIEVAPTLSNAELAERYGVAENTITNWRRKCGLSRSRQRVIPDDIAEMAKTMTLKDLALACGYGEGSRLGERLRCMGLDAVYQRALQNSDNQRRVLLLKQNIARRGTGKKTKVEVKKPNPRGQPIKWNAMKLNVNERMERDHMVTRIQLAMRFLQWKGPGACFPMSVREAGSEDYWYVGRRWSAEELMEEATRRGWKEGEA